MATAPANVSSQLELLLKGAVDVIRVDDLRERLQVAAREGRSLTVKVGFDPSAPDLHLGHTVVIRKMRHFQQLGHRVVFLIGDFTGMIGDPTGKKVTRPQLSREQVLANADTYKRQIFKLLDPERTVIDFNSRWLGPLSSEEWIRLTARVTLAQILERDDFSKRLAAGDPISLHELLYPVSQAYDSVFLRADVELGGTDQLFNLLVGRDLMGKLGLPAQIVMTLPLLEGLDGVEKMSKSLGNYVGVEDPPEEMFGKLMSISDQLMWKYWTLLTDLDPAGVAALQRAVAGGERHPMDVKFELARTITADFHDASAAKAAEAHFRSVHQRREVPDEVPDLRLVSTEPTIVLTRLLALSKMASSNAEARRLVEQGGVRLEGEVVRDPQAVVITTPGRAYLLQVGKRRFVRVRFETNS
ncbi:MAG TPA: tyrosine--tRNA ligase [Thermoanaerobaculaceae bacterium]|nr:tyrosine--tRNA ligase [Thermoanaerobaculaceae bacterium]HPS79510.1 tyrosine--tRNA ligase [Thermoanaerobaculaceae bacterium]